MNHHFDKETIRRLTRGGITITGLQAIPGNGDMPFANAETGYVVNDNGTSKVWTYYQVLTAAALFANCY